MAVRKGGLQNGHRDKAGKAGLQGNARRSGNLDGSYHAFACDCCVT